MFLIGLYLGAIILANISVTVFGPASTIVNAFLFIGLDLTARDQLHDSWRGKNLVLKMGALIAVGSILSWLLNRNAGPIALASFVAFGLSGMVDAIVYSMLESRSDAVRVNGSNLASALVDSIVFPTLAFGGMMLWVTIGQFLAKVLGGYVWSLILCSRGQELGSTLEGETAKA